MISEIDQSIEVIQNSFNQSRSNKYNGEIENLKKIGSILFQQMLPDKAKEIIQSSSGGNLYLRLDDKLVHVPWELCFDGENFIGLKYFIGKQIITDHRNQVSAERAGFQEGLVRALLVADPTETLEAASREVEQLANLLDQCNGFQVSILGGRQVTKTALLRAFGEFDLIHYAGHADFVPEKPKQSGWMLQGSILTSEEIRKLPKVPALIFSNSCQSGTSFPREGHRGIENKTFGVGSSFLLAGVKNYIGTPWRLQDKISAEFSVSFYQNLVKGGTLGESLLAAKKVNIKEYGLMNPLWASYSLFGDPAYRFPLLLENNQTVKFVPNVKPSRSLVPVLLLLLLVVGFLGYPYLKDYFGGKVEETLISRTNSIKPPEPQKEEILKPYEHYFMQAYNNFHIGNVSLALKQFQDLSKETAEPAKLYGLAGQAMVFFEARLLNRANEILEKVSSGIKKNFFASLVKGDILFSKGDLKKTKIEYQKAAKSKLNAIRAEALNAIGYIFWQFGEKENAMDAFQQSLKARADNRFALNNIGYYLLQEGETRKATDNFNRVLNIYLEDEFALYFLKKILQSELEPKSNFGEKTIAVLPLTVSAGTPRVLGIGEVISGKLSDSLKANNFYTVPLKLIKDILSEEKLRKPLSKTTVVRIGKDLSASFVAYGNLSLFSNVAELDLNLLRTSDGTLFLSQSIRIERKPLIAKTVAEATNMISSTFSHSVLE